MIDRLAQMDRTMDSLSFDPMVRYYDETRCINGGCLELAIKYLVKKYPPEDFKNVLEPGIGTGRIAIPLAQHGYDVHGVDISEQMLAVLDQRLKESGPRLRVSFQRADVTDLPFPDGRFDMVVVVHLFYFVREWKKAVDELLRVLRRDGPLILMHTGTGMEIPFVNDRYRAYCAEHGFRIDTPGVGSTQEVVSYLTELGYPTEFVRDRWRWTNHIRLDKAISYIRSRAYSFTTMVPDSLHSEAVCRVESEARKEFRALHTEVLVPNQVYLVSIRKRAATNMSS
jgi:ubiquinone/menaquinone biosynthesis C-methylase UbiE